MNTTLARLLLATIISVTAVTHVSAAVRYVNVASAGPAPPYASWATAARTIQDAIDVAAASDEIVVTNGVYQSGGRAVSGTLISRVAVTKPLTLRSVNGPGVTVIQGYQVPGITNGTSASRCVYLTNGAALIGFTLTNGATWAGGDDLQERSGGGVWCESTNAVVTNCVFVRNSADIFGGGAFRGTLNNCIFTGNSAGVRGGGVSGTFENNAILNNCTLKSNSAAYGGATFGAKLYNCTLTANSAGANGGGASVSTLNTCTLAGNSAGYGGGASDSTINNCTLIGNSADSQGGGAFASTLNNCTLMGNSAYVGGGAAVYEGVGVTFGGMSNCMVTGNSAVFSGGGVSGGTLDNCIVYYNTANISNANYSSATLNYSCTTPIPSSGVGNISDEPQLASASHLSATSPCRGAGSPVYTRGLDIDGEVWANPPSIGCDEYRPGGITGPLSVAIKASFTNVAVGFKVEFTGLITGHAEASRWDFAGGMVISNRPYATHVWLAPGDYQVVLTAYNESHPEGVSATMTVRVTDVTVHYVAQDSSNPVAPYISWATAATRIQDAINSAALPGAVILVTNGVYAAGGRVVRGALTNRVAATKPVTVRSVNGPAVTRIAGYQVPGSTNGNSAVRCVYLTNGAALVGFTLTNGATLATGDVVHAQSGGGVWCESTNAMVSNCVLVGNSAYQGGGAFNGSLNNCTLTGNSASELGGGALLGALNNCTLSGNAARVGGGVYDGTLENCIVYYNTANISGANYSSSGLDYSCTTPMPSFGVGNISNEPQLASASHLSAASPCRGAGSAAHTSGVDIDGEVWAAPPSIGCDEYRAGSLTGPLSVAIRASVIEIMVGSNVQFTALIEGRIGASRWDFADGTVVSNQPYVGHVWQVPGDYAVVLTAYNDSHPGGVSATLTVRMLEGTHYVSPTSTNPVPPYYSWATAATNIQDAVDAAVLPGALILVTNGVYDGGGKRVNGALTNRVAATKPVIVRSVNGPSVTRIVGYQVPGTRNGDSAVRCVYLTNGAALVGFTLTNGATLAMGDLMQDRSGGGVWCESTSAVVSNCVLVGNSANYAGGGAHGCTLNNCALNANSASTVGGGVSGGALNNCTLTGNSANVGGGASDSTLSNCIVYYNTANVSNVNYSSATLNYSCTTPMPASGVGNISDAPAIVDLTGGNLRLTSNSPCINSGNNAVAPGSTDLDGRSRIVSSTVDIGAYEFQGGVTGEFIGWLQQYGLPTDGSADNTDPDGDGVTNLQEWRAGSDPTQRHFPLLHSLIDPGLAPQEGANQGFSVALDGNIAVVGVPRGNAGGYLAGQVNVYDVTTGALLHTLANPKPAMNDSFGNAVAISGMKVVAGARDDQTGAPFAGSAYVYDLASASPNVPMATLNNPSPEVYDFFGRAVAISGMRVLVGTSRNVHVYDLARSTPTLPVATLTNSAVAVAISGARVAALGPGSVYIFDLESATPAVPITTLPNPTPGAANNFGWAVAISGTRVVVGAYADDTEATDTGSAYVYDVTSVAPTVPIATIRNPGPGANDHFGWAVAISGTRVVIGAYRDDTGATDAGSAYVYDLASPAPTVPITTLSNPSPTLEDYFGYAVAISGTQVVIGAYRDDTGAGNTGRTYVYDLASATPAVPVAELASPSPVQFDFYGSAVAISGTRVVVGDYLDRTNKAGSAYVYELASATPTVPVVTLTNPIPSVYGSFGYAVALSGTRLVIGAPYDDTGAPNAGSAYVYELASATPTVPVATLTNPSPATNDWFGYAVAISGTRVVIGAYQDDTGPTDTGIAYVYDLASAMPTVPITLNNPSPAHSDRFGYAVAISGTRVVVGSFAASAYAYDLATATPTVPVATLNNPSLAHGRFGSAVAISDTRVAVGSPLNQSAYVYDLAGITPAVPLLTLTNTGPNFLDYFGWAVAISGTRVLVGAYEDFAERIGRGSVKVFDLTSPTPSVPVDTLINPSPGYEDSFGSAVAIDGRTIVVGSQREDPSGTNRNAAYIFGPTQALSIINATVTEGNAGATNAVFTVRLATAHTDTVSVDFATVDDTAIAGSDYVATNGTLIFNPGETGKTLTVPVLGDILDEANETFLVRLNNPTNISLVQTQAIVTILDDDIAVTITLQPAHQFVRPGSNVTFRVSVASTFPPITYQWRFNGINILNATNSLLNLTNVQFIDTGDYSVVVADSRSFAVSASARLTVLIAPVITQQPQNLTVVVGASATFSVAVSNTAALPINYQWRKISAPITNILLNSYNCSFTLYNVTTNNAGQYRVVVTNAATTGQGVGSVLVTLTVVTSTVLPSVTLTSPTNGAAFICPANITLSANASDSDGSVSRVEFYAGTNRLGVATDSPYSLTWSNAPAGNYALVARALDNLGAVSNSAPVNITVTDPVPATLSIAWAGTNALLSWPQSCSNFRLEVTASFNPTNWAPSTAPVTPSVGQWNATVPVTNTSSFFRLRRE